MIAGYFDRPAGSRSGCVRAVAGDTQTCRSLYDCSPEAGASTRWTRWLPVRGDYEAAVRLAQRGAGQFPAEVSGTGEVMASIYSARKMGLRRATKLARAARNCSTSETAWQRPREVYGRYAAAAPVHALEVMACVAFDRRLRTHQGDRPQGRRRKAKMLRHLLAARAERIHTEVCEARLNPAGARSPGRTASGSSKRACSHPHYGFRAATTPRMKEHRRRGRAHALLREGFGSATAPRPEPTGCPGRGRSWPEDSGGRQLQPWAAGSARRSSCSTPAARGMRQPTWLSRRRTSRRCAARTRQLPAGVLATWRLRFQTWPA